MGLSCKVLHYAARPQARNDQLLSRIQQLAAERRRFGYRRIHALLRREGVNVNVKRLHCLYCEEALQVRHRRRRRGVSVERRPLLAPQAPTEVWSINFAPDALEHGRHLKCLTIVDDFTKEAVDIVVDHGISGHYVTRVLEQAARSRELSSAIRTDQGPESTAKALDQWAYERRIELRLIEAAKPHKTHTSNALTANSPTSISMNTGPDRCPKRVPSSPRGAWVTTSNARTARRTI
jgi:putative transposase